MVDETTHLYAYEDVTPISLEKTPTHPESLGGPSLGAGATCHQAGSCQVMA